MSTEQYDIIGDIHGHADELLALLKKLGYSHTISGYCHPTKRVIFLGDFIDRGPKQREVLQIVMAMVNQGSALAVMGNHEFNALAFHTEHPSNPGKWLRPRNNKNIQQHLVFLQEYCQASRGEELDEVLAFFRSLPLWLELPGLRIVHACWDQKKMDLLKPLNLNPDNTLTPELLVDASTENTPEYHAIERILKGAELALPGDLFFRDKDGHERHNIRTKWWVNKDSTLNEVSFSPLDDEVGNTVVEAKNLVGYPPEEPPVFLGHYWLRGKPSRLAENVACVDYSVAKDGKLMAYRWSGEHVIDDSNFVF